MSSRTPGRILAAVAALLAVVAAAAGCSDAAGSPHETQVTATRAESHQLDKPVVQLEVR